MSSHIKKIVALVLSFTMIFTSGALTVFAGEAAAQKPEETYNIVTFGDSMTSGYGTQEFWKGGTQLGGFDHVASFAYPNAIKDYLEKENLVDKPVKVSKFNFEGMMMSDVHIMLGKNGKEQYAEETRIVHAEDPTNYYKDHHWSHLRSWTAEKPYRWTEDKKPVKLYNDEVYDNPDRIDTIRKVAQERVKNADVVILDNLNSSFGIYEVKRLTTILEYMNNMENFEESGYANYVEDFGNSKEIQKVVKDVRKKLRSKLNGLKIDGVPVSAAVLTELIESLTYTTVEGVYSVAATVKDIKRLNPNAEIIIVGPENPIKSLKLKISGINVNLGGIIDVLLTSFGTYFKYLGIGAKDYTYVDMLKTDHIQLLSEKWASWSGVITDKDHENEYVELLSIISSKDGDEPAITPDRIKLAREYYQSEIKQTFTDKELAQIWFAIDNASDKDKDLADEDLSEDQLKAALATMSQKLSASKEGTLSAIQPKIDQVVTNVAYCAAHPEFDIGEMISDGLGDFGNIAKSLVDALQGKRYDASMLGDSNVMSPSERTLLSLFVACMMQSGTGAHPSEAGCITKAKVIEKALAKVVKTQKAKQAKQKKYKEAKSAISSIVKNTAKRINKLADTTSKVIELIILMNR